MDSYDIFMVGDTHPYTFQELILPDGGRVRFDAISTATDFASVTYVATTSQGPFYGAVLSFNQPSGASLTIVRDACWGKKGDSLN